MNQQGKQMSKEGKSASEQMSKVGRKEGNDG
jgi:hypothetical protein